MNPQTITPPKHISILPVLIALLVLLLLLFAAFLAFQNMQQKKQIKQFPDSLENQYSTKCVKGGCNGEVCEDANGERSITICMALPQYGCYKNAKCEVQDNGKCGWTLTNKLKMCLSKY